MDLQAIQRIPFHIALEISRCHVVGSLKLGEFESSSDDCNNYLHRSDVVGVVNHPALHSHGSRVLAVRILRPRWIRKPSAIGDHVAVRVTTAAENYYQRDGYQKRASHPDFPHRLLAIGLLLHDKVP